MFVIYIKLSLWPDDVISDYKRYFFPINNNNYALYGFIIPSPFVLVQMWSWLLPLKFLINLIL